MNKINQFITLFEEYNSHTNLMSKNEVKNLAIKHIPDCLTIKYFFDKYGLPKNIIDIGTGGGLPALPIAIEYPDIKVIAVDSIAKKINFVKSVQENLNLSNIDTFCTRIEDLKNKEKYDVATTRAVASLSVILEYCAPFVKQNGYIVAYKSKNADDELLETKNAMKILGVKFIEKINCKLSLNEDFERCLLVFQKIKTTPKIYPRTNNIARKNPL